MSHITPSLQLIFNPYFPGHPPAAPFLPTPPTVVPRGSRHVPSLTQRWEEAVPGARGGQGGARLREEVPARLGGLPAGHVGQLGPGPRLRAR